MLTLILSSTLTGCDINWRYSRDGRTHDDTMNMVESGVEISSSSKPLSQLTIGEVGFLLEALKLDK